MIDHPRERTAADYLECAGCFLLLEVDHSDAVQTVIPSDKELAVGGHRIGAGSGMYACDVRKHDLGWFQQVAGVGADREIGCATGTSGAPHLRS